jgi:hypothetical protein
MSELVSNCAADASGRSYGVVGEPERLGALEHKSSPARAAERRR